jgi:teichuronic acid biosynthesis glycosyltransferase TuaG
MNQPLVSVIMPAYNAEKFIDASIESILRQTYRNWELIVTDDGSRDGTAAKLAGYADPRIHVLRQENKGVSAARNAALSNMRGEYFTFLDADDLLPENSLAIRMQLAASKPEADFIAGSVSFFSEDGSVRNWHPAYKGDPLQPFIRIDERAFCNPSLLIKRKPGIRYAFLEGMSHVEDLLFFATVAHQAPHQYDFVNEKVYEYRITGGTAMSNLKGLEKGYWTFYREVSRFPEARPGNLRYLKWRIIRIMILSYLAAGKLMPAFGVLPKMFTR